MASMASQIAEQWQSFFKAHPRGLVDSMVLTNPQYILAACVVLVELRPLLGKGPLNLEAVRLFPDSPESDPVGMKALYSTLYGDLENKVKEFSTMRKVPDGNRLVAKLTQLGQLFGVLSGSLPAAEVKVYRSSPACRSFDWPVGLRNFMASQSSSER